MLEERQPINRVGSGGRLVRTSATAQRHQRMLHGDDLIEPRPEKLLLSRPDPLPWSHSAFAKADTGE